MSIVKSRSLIKKIRWEFIFVAAFLILAVLYVSIHGDNIYVPVFDNLDSTIATNKMYQDNDFYFSIGESIPYLGGSVESGIAFLKLYNWLYILLPTFAAYVTGWFLGLIISMIGFVLLGKELIPNYEENKGAVLFFGLIYGLLPTFPSQVFGFASLPLLFYLLVKLYRTKRKRYLIFIFLYPTLSSVACFGLIACIFIFMFFIIEWIVKRKPSWRMLVAAFVLGAGYIATEWMMFYSMLFSGSTSIRSTFVYVSKPFWLILKKIVYIFITGHIHSGDLHAYILLPVCGLFFLYLNVRYLKRKEYKKIFSDPFNWLMVWLLFNSVIYCLDSTPTFKKIISTVSPPLSSFSFARTLWFSPFLWYFSYMTIVCRLKKRWLKTVLEVLSFVVLCVYPVTYNVLGCSVNMIKDELLGQENNRMTYRDFYSEDLFEEIKTDIGYDGEWSIAYGMYPAVLEYNGIATLDGYLSKYPAEYKEQFRELIEPQLEVDEKHATYFDNWGGRAYVFSDEISYKSGKYITVTEATMRIDPEVFREMGGEYVFSRVLVKNADDLGLEQVGVYTNDESPYTIYVYQAENED